MVLLSDVVEVLDLAHHDRHVAANINRIDGRLAGATFVHCDLVRIFVFSHGLVEEALRREQKVDSLSLLVD